MLGRRTRSRSPVIVLLLVATLAMAAMLAYEAQQAARSHRVTAENVLRDYAAFAAWELSRLGRQQLLSIINLELHETQQAIERGGLDAALAPSTACTAGCGGEHRVRTAFHASLPEARFTFAGKPIDPRLHDRLSKIAADVLRAPDDHTCPVLEVASVNGEPAVLVWRVVFAPQYKPTGIVGFVSDGPFVAAVFEKLLRQTPLLPPSLMPANAGPNAALAIRVAAEGHQVFASAQEWSAYASEQELPKDLGGLNLSVALKPDAAGRLVIGGLPRERLPLVIGLLTLTVGLVVVALIQLRREAELSRLRSDFVSGVSHELRTPLAQIRMFSETLLLGRVRSEIEGRRSLEIIARETQRLTQLVENVLFFSRGERRQPQVARESARLAPILGEVVESFGPLAAARRAHLVTHLDGAVAAKIDGGGIRQILLNLLDNAVKYGPPGQTVTIVLSLHDGRARLVVEDEGPGVDPQDAERVWRPFNRLANAAAVTGGTGIGLSIVRQLADLHDGRAWVERGARGARFVVEIPGAWSEPAASAAVA